MCALVVNGAGCEDANGCYVPTDRSMHGAPVYANDWGCLVSREPHKGKSGKVSFGWVLGLDRRALYGAQSESLQTPHQGWRRFTGAPPIPRVLKCDTVEEAALQAAQAWKAEGVALFTDERYEEAEKVWTRALDLARLAEPMLRVALLSNRAESRLRRRLWSGALCDAEAALAIMPQHDKALLRAAVAARELKLYAKAKELLARCLEAHPEHPEASRSCADIDRLIYEDRCTTADSIPSTRAKLRESLRREAQRVARRLPVNLAEDKAAGTDNPSHQERERLSQDDREHIRIFSETAKPRGKSSFQHRLRALDQLLHTQEQGKQDETDRSVLAHLRELSTRREPSRFEQSAGELYCWWTVLPEVSGADVKVECSGGGTKLRVVIRGVVVFDGVLFAKIKADDLVWSVADSELHLTLTKSLRSKLWDSLGEEVEAQTDERGNVLQETLAQPRTAAERLEMFKQLVHGDDGHQVSYDTLDQPTKMIVDAIRRREHAQATGDEAALAEAEVELEEMSPLVI